MHSLVLQWDRPEPLWIYEKRMSNSETGALNFFLPLLPLTSDSFGLMGTMEQISK